jgi:hypothetical protein
LDSAFDKQLGFGRIDDAGNLNRIVDLHRCSTA